MSILSNSFKLGNIAIDKDYCMTREQMKNIDPSLYPPVFPIWCTDDNCLYMMYRQDNGEIKTEDISNAEWNKNPVILYPKITDGTLTWELRYLSADEEIPSVDIIGKSAYEIWLDAGNEGTIQDFLASLKGEKGDPGEDGSAGETIVGEKGEPGENGKSAYELWQDAGNEGTEADFLASLKGDPGQDGNDGINGANGENGKSAYNIWLEAGTDGEDGTDGLPGENGKSAYEIWQDAGNTGSEAEFLASLKGETGEKGDPGQNGTDGVNGANGENGKSAYELWQDAGNEGSEADFLASLKGEKGDSGINGSNGMEYPDNLNGPLFVYYNPGTIQTKYMFWSGDTVDDCYINVYDKQNNTLAEMKFEYINNPNTLIFIIFDRSVNKYCIGFLTRYYTDNADKFKLQDNLSDGEYYSLVNVGEGTYAVPFACTVSSLHFIRTEFFYGSENGISVEMVVMSSTSGESIPDSITLNAPIVIVDSISNIKYSEIAFVLQMASIHLF